MIRLALLSGILTLLLLTSASTRANQYSLSVGVPAISSISAKQTIKTLTAQEIRKTELVFHASGKKKPDFPPEDIDEGRQRRKAKWAKWLGIGSLVGLILPILGVLSLPAAIVAVITGNQAKRNSADRVTRNDANTGVITGWITIGLFVLALALVVLIIAAFGGW